MESAKRNLSNTPRSNELATREDGDIVEVPPSPNLDAAVDLSKYKKVLQLLERAKKDPAVRVMMARAVCTHNHYKSTVFTDMAGTFHKEVTRLKQIREKEFDAMGLTAEQKQDARSKAEGPIADAQKMESQLHHASQECLALTDSFRTEGPRVSDAQVHANVQQLCAKLRTRVDILKAFSSGAPEALEMVCNILLAFFANPFTVQQRFINFMVLGSAGTGKTTVCKKMAEVFVAANIFRNALSIKSKPDFIGSHLGETAPRTMEALRTVLDGVCFIDEAYSLTPIDEERNDVDMYGAEFAAALVDYMTRFKGLYCIIVGGYKDKMQEQFLKANEGLERRFPYIFTMRDVTEESFVKIVNGQMLKLSGYTEDEAAREDAPMIMTPRAASFLERMIHHVRADGGAFKSLRAMLRHQAGSATNIAEFIALHRDSSEAQFEVMLKETKQSSKESTLKCAEFSKQLMARHGIIPNMRLVQESVRLWIESASLDMQPRAVLREFRALEEKIGSLDHVPDELPEASAPSAPRGDAAAAEKRVTRSK